ncbi:MAG: hypothetical protein DHS20C02_10440 [Micavibrio sp.]|nr:MAG: hypothetical protein DHS20C02_10440 [Micavibrio sp.]
MGWFTDFFNDKAEIPTKDQTVGFGQDAIEFVRDSIEVVFGDGVTTHLDGDKFELWVVGDDTNNPSISITRPEGVSPADWQNKINLMAEDMASNQPGMMERLGDWFEEISGGADFGDLSKLGAAAGAALSAITPDFIEDGVKAAYEAVLGDGLSIAQNDDKLMITRDGESDSFVELERPVDMSPEDWKTKTDQIITSLQNEDPGMWAKMGDYWDEAFEGGAGEFFSKAGDAALGGLSAITPDFIEDGVKSAYETVFGNGLTSSLSPEKLEITRAGEGEPFVSIIRPDGMSDADWSAKAGEINDKMASEQPGVFESMGDWIEEVYSDGVEIVGDPLGSLKSAGTTAAGYVEGVYETVFGDGLTRTQSSDKLEITRDGEGGPFVSILRPEGMGDAEWLSKTNEIADQIASEQPGVLERIGDWFGEVVDDIGDALGDPLGALEDMGSAISTYVNGTYEMVFGNGLSSTLSTDTLEISRAGEGEPFVSIVRPDGMSDADWSAKAAEISEKMASEQPSVFESMGDWIEEVYDDGVEIVGDPLGSLKSAGASIAEFGSDIYEAVLGDGLTSGLTDDKLMITRDGENEPFVELTRPEGMGVDEWNKQANQIITQMQNESPDMWDKMGEWFDESIEGAGEFFAKAGDAALSMYESATTGIGDSYNEFMSKDGIGGQLRDATKKAFNDAADPSTVSPAIESDIGTDPVIGKPEILGM